LSILQCLVMKERLKIEDFEAFKSYIHACLRPQKETVTRFFTLFFKLTTSSCPNGQA
jgi:hypothetical protein